MKDWKPEQIDKEQVKEIMTEFSVPSIVAMLLSMKSIAFYTKKMSLTTHSY